MPGQTSKGQAYGGVGLELYANTSSYFRYSTKDSEIDIRTNKFFFGNPSSSFISGSNGLLQISSSNFILSPEGAVTASAFIAVNGSNVLFDTNNEFADALNIGRIVYFDQTEYTYSLASLPTTSSGVTGSGFAGPVFETFILPGETRIQVSYTFQIDRTDLTFGNTTCQLSAFIANSVTGSNVGLNSYGIFTNSTLVAPDHNITTAPSASQRSGANTKGFIDTGDVISDRQGMYVLIHTMIKNSNLSSTGTLKLKTLCLELVELSVALQQCRHSRLGNIYIKRNT